MKDKILIITPNIPPFQSSQSLMVYKLLKELDRRKFRLYVLSEGLECESDEMLNKLSDNVQIFRTYKYSKIINGMENIDYLKTFHLNWLSSALKKGRGLLSETDIDLIWSRYTPVAPNILALILKREFNLPWVIHFSDPWTSNPYYKRTIVDFILENLVIKNADYITFSTKYIEKIYKNKYDIGPDKTSVIPNFTDIHMKDKPREIVNKNPKMILTSIGSFYKKRSPEPLFKALTLLDNEIRSNISLKVIGSLGEFANLVQKYSINELVDYVGYIPHNQLDKYINITDVLILVDAPLSPSIFLPNKLVEYLFTKKPILGITSEIGASSDVISKTNTGKIVSPDKPVLIAKEIERLYNKFKMNDLSVKPNYNEIFKFTSESAGDKFSKIFKNIIISSKNKYV